jgi:hypothetical protein
MIGFVASVSSDPKYIIPPTNPRIEQGMVTACDVILFKGMANIVDLY